MEKWDLQTKFHQMEKWVSLELINNPSVQKDPYSKKKSFQKNTFFTFSLYYLTKKCKLKKNK